MFYKDKILAENAKLGQKHHSCNMKLIKYAVKEKNKMKKIYKIEGMHCASCARNIENSVKKLKEIKSCSVNFATKKLYVEGEANEKK